MPGARHVGDYPAGDGGLGADVEEAVQCGEIGCGVGEDGAGVGGVGGEGFDCIWGIGVGL